MTSSSGQNEYCKRLPGFNVREIIFIVTYGMDRALIIHSSNTTVVFPLKKIF